MHIWYEFGQCGSNRFRVIVLTRFWRRTDRQTDRRDRWQYPYGLMGRGVKIRMESYLYPVREGQRNILTSTLAAFIQQLPKREVDQEAHLNTTLAPTTWGDKYHTAESQLNQIQQSECIRSSKIHKTQHKHNTLKPASVASYDLRPVNGVG